MKIKKWFQEVKQVGVEFSEADPFTQSAALAFYTLFSLPAIVFFITQIAGYFFGQEVISGQFYYELERLVGAEAAEMVNGILKKVSVEGDNRWASLVSLGTLLIGATTVFGALQNGLNRVWTVKPSDKVGWFKVVKDRLFSFSIVLVLGFLMMVSLSIDALLLLLEDYINSAVPGVSAAVLMVVNLGISFVVMTGLFGLVLNVLPDVKLTWKQSAVGGMITAILFYVGKFLIGLYLEQSDFNSTYGGAGSLVLLLVWVYYSSLVVLFGGKITQVYVLKTTGEIPTSELSMKYKIVEKK